MKMTAKLTSKRFTIFLAKNKTLTAKIKDSKDDMKFTLKRKLNFCNPKRALPNKLLRTAKAKVNTITKYINLLTPPKKEYSG